MPKQLTNDGTSAVRRDVPVLDDPDLEPDRDAALAALNVVDLVALVESGEVSPEDALAAEQAGRARPTAIQALEDLAYDDDLVTGGEGGEA